MVGSLLLASVASLARADDLATSLYLRTDSDSTTVISPRARVGKRIGESTEVDATYAADVWTSASIDIRTSASVRPVTEQRDELDLSFTHELNSDLSLNGAYRFSKENDYLSHGLSAGGSYNFANNAATIDLGLHAIADSVRRSGDPTFSRGLGTVDTRLAFTQVLDPVTILQATYELALLNGYQSSPYRFVGVGGTGYGCMGAAQCLPEHVPDSRTRHALALLVRRAFSDEISLGLNYRYYFDNWSLGSHTVLASLGWIVAEGSTLALRYRFYTQGEVNFYQARYTTLPSPSIFTTRDRELSPLSYHRLGVELDHEFPFDNGATKLTSTVGIGGSFFNYSNFVGLSSITALEVTFALVLHK